MVTKYTKPTLKIEQNNETESGKRFLKRFQIAAIGIDFGHKIVEEDAEKKNQLISQTKGAAMLNILEEEGMEIFENLTIPVDEIQFETLVIRFE